MRRPDPKPLAFAVLAIAASTLVTAEAGTKRTEYRYPDRPDIVFTENGAQRAAEPNRPMAFASFESAVSVADARSVSKSASDSYYSELPRRVDTPVASSRSALVSEPVIQSSAYNTAPAYQPPVQSYQPPAPQYTASRGDYAIQAGAFSSADNAERMAEQLASFGNARVSEGYSNGRTVYRVYLGGFSSKDQAQPALNQMKARGFDGFVTRAS